MGGVIGTTDPLTLFAHIVDFVTPATIGDTAMAYNNNTNDGRPFREQTNFTACFVENAAGLLVSVPASAVRRSDRGFVGYPRGTNRCLYNCDVPAGITAGAWVSSGGGITAVKDQTGGDGAANSASRLTANGANARLTQSVTLAQTNLLFQMRMKRLVGTGKVNMTLDNWTTKTDVTALLGSSAYGLCFMSQDTVTNPQFGIELEASGDQIAVEFGDVWSTLISGAQVSRKPQRYFNRQTTTATNVAQSRMAAISTDAGSWNGVGGSLFLTPYALFAEVSCEGNAGSMGVVTGITDTFCTILPDGSVTYGQGGGTSASVPAGTFQFGLANINRIACQVNASGQKQIAVNGVLGTDGASGTFPASLAHIDIFTNGVGSRSLFGLGRKIAASSGLWLTPAQRTQLTAIS
ncbi:hypothetical protein [Mesorhizobium sp.]|uniref:hypothetical protein n=1 Tax=Mesorhizobium sp. TaxID=1871066 RepID=UPI0012055EC6|nr:hypothetical protein [Mesorhizobium sp.]TIN83105.1 MAG: hypothetical protein E5X97_27620 [Mesorhizobium sp.]